jgi:hypothetical protein
MFTGSVCTSIREDPGRRLPKSSQRKKESISYVSCKLVWLVPQDG